MSEDVYTTLVGLSGGWVVHKNGEYVHGSWCFTRWGAEQFARRLAREDSSGDRREKLVKI
jgi:hypothetical protein